MAARHVALASAGLMLWLVSGCKSNEKTAGELKPDLNATAPEAPEITTVEPAPESPEAVARRAERYTADLEAAIAKRDARDRAERERLAPPATAPAVPSAVQWTEPAPPAVVPVPVAPVPVAVAPVPVAPQPVIVTPPPVALPSVAVSNAGATVGFAPLSAPPTDVVEKALLRKIKENPRDAAAQLDWQLLQFVRERPSPDLQAMAGLPEEDREVLSAVLDGLSNFRAGVRNDNNMMLSKKVRPLIDSAERLRGQAELHLPVVQLCTRVDTFGVYEPIDPVRFVAGKEGQAVLYTEVSNFASQLNDKSKWETKLSQEAVLYTETGLPVVEEKAQVVPDASRNRRTDFFIARVIKFPPNLTIGRYLLKVTVTDLQASRVAEATVPVTIVAK